MVRDDASKLDPKDSEQAVALIKTLSAKSKSKSFRQDLDAVGRRLTQLNGRPTRETIESLMHTGPNAAP
jgi:hypothetical protein